MNPDAAVPFNRHIRDELSRYLMSNPDNSANLLSNFFEDKPYPINRSEIYATVLNVFWTCNIEMLGIMFASGYFPKRLISNMYYDEHSNPFEVLIIEILEFSSRQHGTVLTYDDIMIRLMILNEYLDEGYKLQNYRKVNFIRGDYINNPEFIYYDDNPDIVYSNLVNIFHDNECCYLSGNNERILITLIRIGVPIPEFDSYLKSNIDMPLETPVCEFCKCALIIRPECEFGCNSDPLYVQSVEVDSFVCSLISKGCIDTLNELYIIAPDKVKAEFINADEYLNRYSEDIEKLKYEISDQVDPDNPERNLSMFEYFIFDFDSILDKMREFVEMVRNT
jgi:hypothetical protein